MAGIDGGGPEEASRPLYVPEGPDQGRVADVGAAQELAQLEDPLQKREGALQREFGTGLTDAQRANVEIMNGIEAKYPLAFDRVMDDKGRKLLAINVVGSSDQPQLAWGLGKRLFITQEGVFTHESSNVALSTDRLDATRFMDQLSNGEYLQDRNSLIFSKEIIKKDAKYFPDSVHFRRLDLGDPHIMASMKYQFEQRQKWVEDRQQEQSAKQAKLDPKAILSQL